LAQGLLDHDAIQCSLLEHGGAQARALESVFLRLRAWWLFDFLYRIIIHSSETTLWSISSQKSVDCVRVLLSRTRAPVSGKANAGNEGLLFLSRANTFSSELALWSISLQMSVDHVCVLLSRQKLQSRERRMT